VIAILPFLILINQLGLSWWLGSASLSCLIFLRLVNYKKNLLTTGQLFFYICIVLGSFLGLLLNRQTSTHDVMRVLRELVMFGLIFTFANAKLHKVSLKHFSKLIPMSLVATGLLLLFTVFQYIYLRKGMLKVLPSGLYAGRSTFQTTALDLKWSHIRPPGPFTEPSYLGLIFLTFLVVATPRIAMDAKSKLMALFSFMGIILCQSKSALIFAILILGITLLKSMKIGSKGRKRHTNSKSVFVLIGLVILACITIIQTTILSSIGSESLAIRIFNPAKIVLGFLSTNPLGQPFYDRLNLLADPSTGIAWNNISDNSIFNLVFSYGIVGIFILIGIFSISRKNVILWIFLLAGLLQNGGFLDVDKVAIIFVTFALYYYASLDLAEVDFSFSAEPLEQKNV